LICTESEASGTRLSFQNVSEENYMILTTLPLKSDWFGRQAVSRTSVFIGCKGFKLVFLNSRDEEPDTDRSFILSKDNIGNHPQLNKNLVFFRNVILVEI